MLENKIPIIFGSFVGTSLIAFFVVIFFVTSSNINANNLLNKNEEISFSELPQIAKASEAKLEYVDLSASYNKYNEAPKIQNKFLVFMEQYKNEDIVGHLKINGTSINYPVFQSSDNKFYLNRDYTKNYNVAGSIFLDYENNISSLDKNTVIYGHNMNQDYMFHSLRYYNDKKYFDTHKYITFDTLYENQTWEIFSYYKTDISFNYIKVFFEDEKDFANTLKEMKQKSIYDTGVSVSTNDRILTLSTCSNQEEDTRLVINAKLVSHTPYKNVLN